LVLVDAGDVAHDVDEFAGAGGSFPRDVVECRSYDGVSFFQ
jgi:hypothetical protein